MSKIVKAKVDVAMIDVEVLEKALRHHGEVQKHSDDRLTLYKNSQRTMYSRINFKRNRIGGFEAYHDDMSSWAKAALPQIADHYIAHHYEAALVKDGYNVNIVTQHDGSLELVAEEGAW
ncbi:MAG: hypothetical protein ACR2PS_03070 [Pseudomonadales bacterium]